MDYPTCKSRVETGRGSDDCRETNGAIVLARLRNAMKFKRWREQGGELLPGITDDIVLKHVSTKLSWRDVHVLSSVSPGWQQALQRGEISHSRADYYDSTEPLVVIPQRQVCRKYGFDETLSFSLYSLRDKYSCGLPASPFNIVWTFVPEFLSLDRKIYVMGAITPPRIAKNWLELVEEPNPNVYVLDLGKKQWKQCASKNEPRRDRFAAAALDGKIYVFGGIGHRVVNGQTLRCPLSSSEVYDPEIDAWSLIKPMPSSRWNHKIATIGDELFVYGGMFCPRGILGENDYPTFLDVYHPIKAEWRRIVPSDERSKWDTVFTSRGKFHRMHRSEIEVYSIEDDSWSLLHKFQLAPPRPRCTLALGDELLIGDFWTSTGKLTGDLLRSKGFGSKNRVITWEKIQKRSPALYQWIPIQL